MVRRTWLERKLIIMQVCGYKRNSDDYVELREASLICSIDEIEKMIKFMQYVKERHSKGAGEEGIYYSHYRDWDKTWNPESTDIIAITIFDKK